jgi:hypothetical protein
MNNAAVVGQLRTASTKLNMNSAAADVPNVTGVGLAALVVAKTFRRGRSITIVTCTLRDVTLLKI